MGFRALRKTLEAPYTTKVNNRVRTSRGTTLYGYNSSVSKLQPATVQSRQESYGAYPVQPGYTDRALRAAAQLLSVHPG